MNDMLPHLVQTVLTFCLAAWMISAVYNNWRFPRLNEEAVGMVMRFDLMEVEYPEDFAVIKHRRIENAAIIRAAFRLILLMETAAAVLLSVGATCMVAALFGLLPPETARLIATLGTLVFILNWTGFMVGGEYFCYWYCHFGSQATHLMLAIWGTMSLVLLMIS